MPMIAFRATARKPHPVTIGTLPFIFTTSFIFAADVHAFISKA